MSSSTPASPTLASPTLASSTTTVTQTPLAAEVPPFQRRLILFLMPYFMGVTSDFNAAQAEVLETLASYGARTRSEMITAARIIAFSFSALDLLAEAKSTEMAPAMRLRFRACANNLNRSSQQNEESLAKRLACDIPDAAQSADDLLDDMPEAEFEAALQHAQAEIASYRNRLSGVRPGHSPQPQPTPHTRPLGSVMMNAFAQSATRQSATPESATRHAATPQQAPAR